MVLLPNDEEVANSSKKSIPNSRLECTNHTLLQTTMVEIDTLFQTKTAKKKHDLWRSIYLYSLYKGLPLRGEKRVAAYASETNKLYSWMVSSTCCKKLS